MTLPMAAWRVTYTPGNWLVLSGPTMLVVMLPAPARASTLVGDLWRSIVSADSVDALLGLVAEVGLDAMPDFGAFFWDANGLHGLSRGGVRVVDTATGDVALEGRGSVLWNEAALGGTRHLRIDLEPVEDDEVLQLPLVVGAATASALYLTTDPDALPRFPSYEQLGVLPKIPVLGVRPRQRRGDQSPEPEPAPESAEPVQVTVPDEPEQAPEPEAAPAPEPYEAGQAPGIPAVEDEPDEAGRLDEEAASPVGPVADFPGLGDEFPIDDDTDPGPAHATPEEPGPVAAAAPVPVPAPAVPARPAPVVVPPRLGEVDEDGGTVFSTGLAATHKPARPADEPRDPQVLAVPCVNSHANPPGSRTCRICGGSVDSSNPRLIRRPVLAGVHTNGGDFMDIVEGVVIGRAPDSGHGPDGARLLRVSSPSSDISRNHLLITTRDWGIHVTDLLSTNGTTVLPTGEQPFTLRDGASVQVELGTVLDLGDGVSLRIEPPRG